MSGPAGDDPGNLSGHVTVRFPADMVDAAKVLAGSEGLTVSAWIRREVEREAARREQPAPDLAVKLRETAADNIALRTLALELIGVLESLETIHPGALAKWRKRAEPQP